MLNWVGGMIAIYRIIYALWFWFGWGSAMTGVAAQTQVVLAPSSWSHFHIVAITSVEYSQHKTSYC